LRVHQVANQPTLSLDVDRTLAAQAGYTQRDVANNLLVTLSGSGQTSPSFWLNPATGVSYQVATQTPQYRIDSLEDLGRIPVSGGSSGRTQLLENLAAVHREAGMAVVTHYNVQPVVDIFGSVQGRDLGSVAREMDPIIEAARKDLPKGSQLVVRGQIETMNSSFRGLLGRAVIGGLTVATVATLFFVPATFALLHGGHRQASAGTVGDVGERHE